MTGKLDVVDFRFNLCRMIYYFNEFFSRIVFRNTIPLGRLVAELDGKVDKSP
jgi:hypothetical protein